ncbi:tRNA pseudouridine(38-40) synthase TruA [Alistipes sp. OttesenSCG-928-B03]|nr:tRNA pseudouridine(38-40) synthase TruA [Alistipes sp. OttesenSCG-928-B03]
MRYFVQLAYKGTAYNGWQRQQNAPSVQQTLEEALSKLLRAATPLTGCGRTDTGVHASHYVAHFDADTPIADTDDFGYHLNAMLPHDIAIRSVNPVAPEAHARFDAREREYTYFILPFKDPFRRETAWQYTQPLDVEAMNRAAAALLVADDFTTFSKLHSNNKTNICDVRAAHWEWEPAGIAEYGADVPSGRLVFTIRADRFLRNMVRSIVGTLVDVGRGKITPERFAQILAARDRSLASGSAPAQGLFLSNIHY